MIRPILKRGNPLLYEVSREVDNISNIKSVISDLWDTLDAVKSIYDFSRGCGISAPQIGELLRVSVIEFAGEKFTLINAEIKERSLSQVPVREGCLSFFDWRGIPLRYEWVTVGAQDQDGIYFEVRAEGDLSSLFQHELDHLDGILYDTRLAQGDVLIRRPGMPRIP